MAGHLILRKSVQVASCKIPRGFPKPILHISHCQNLCKLHVARFPLYFCSQSCTDRIAKTCASCKLQDSHVVSGANLAQIRTMRSVQDWPQKPTGNLATCTLHRSHCPNLCKIGYINPMGILHLATCTDLDNAICARLAAETPLESCNWHLAQIAWSESVQYWPRRSPGILATCNLHRFSHTCATCTSLVSRPIGQLV